MSDALTIAAIDRNVEAIKTQSSLGALWELLARPNKVDAPQGYERATPYFGKMIASSLWIPHGKSHKSHRQYCPSLRCVGALSDVYMPQEGPGEIALPEKINKVALERYAASQTRLENAALLRGFYKSPSDTCGEKGKRRRQNLADTNTSAEMMNKGERLDFYLSMMKKVISRANSPHQIPGGVRKYSTRYRQSSAGYKGRLQAEGPSMQKCPRRIRQVACGGQEVVDWDVEMEYFAFA